MLSATAPILALVVAAGTHAPRRAERLRPLAELPKAPVEITVPAAPAVAPAPRQAPATPPPAPTDAAAAPGATPDAKAAGLEAVQQRCGRCHPADKALGAAFSPDEWDAYLRRKLRRTAAGIPADQAEVIRRFLRGRAARPPDAGATAR